MQVVSRQKSLSNSVAAEINTMARNLYLAHGEYVAETYSFSSAMTPLGKKCWNSAVICYFNEVVQVFDSSDIEALLLT